MLGYLDRNEEYKEENLPQTHGREAFRANKVYDEMANWEINFAATTQKARTPITQGDEIETAQRFFKKYTALAKEYYSQKEAVDSIKDDKLFENLGE